MGTNKEIMLSMFAEKASNISHLMWYTYSAMSGSDLIRNKQSNVFVFLYKCHNEFLLTGVQ